MNPEESPEIYHAAGEVVHSKSPVGTRYIPESVRMSLWESLRWWIRTGELTRTRIRMRLVEPGSPEYDSAPYELGVVWHR